jgi:hypothetical protein
MAYFADKDVISSKVNNVDSSCWYPLTCYTAQDRCRDWL